MYSGKCMSHFNKEDESSFKMEISLFINSHSWFYTGSGKGSEANNLSETHAFQSKYYTAFTINRNTPLRHITPN